MYYVIEKASLVFVFMIHSVQTLYQSSTFSDFSWFSWLWTGLIPGLWWSSLFLVYSGLKPELFVWRFEFRRWFLIPTPSYDCFSRLVSLRISPAPLRGFEAGVVVELGGLGASSPRKAACENCASEDPPPSSGWAPSHTLCTCANTRAHSYPRSHMHTAHIHKYGHAHAFTPAHHTHTHTHTRRHTYPHSHMHTTHIHTCTPHTRAHIPTFAYAHLTHTHTRTHKHSHKHTSHANIHSRTHCHPQE